MGTKVKRFQIEDDSIDSSKILNESITDDDISATANIKQSKIENLENDLNSKIKLSGDTLTGVLTLNADPAGDLEAATKQYLDSLVSGPSNPTYQFLPDIILTSGTTLTIKPHSFTVNGVTQSSNSDTSLNTALASNFDTFVNTAGTYFIYATGTGFKISKTRPIFSNSQWIIDNVLKWRAICSLIRTANGASFTPFVKSGIINKYMAPPAVGTSVYGGPNANEVLLSVTVSCWNTTKGRASSATFNLIDPATNIIVDYMYVYGKVVNNADRAFRTVDVQLFKAPTLVSGPNVIVNYSGSSYTVIQEGVIERF